VFPAVLIGGRRNRYSLRPTRGLASGATEGRHGFWLWRKLARATARATAPAHLPAAGDGLARPGGAWWSTGGWQATPYGAPSL